MSVTDNFMIVMTAFILALVLFLGFFYLTTLSSSLENVELLNESVNIRSVISDSIPNAISKFDIYFLTIFIMLAIVYWITNWLIGTNPIFLILNFIFMLIGIITSFFIANGWESATEISLFATTKASLPIMNHIISNLPLYAIIISIVGLIFTFGKPYVAGDGY